jgi:hypothetical protein
MLCIWWDMKSIIYFELLNQNQIITSDINSQQLDSLHPALLERHPYFINRKGVILQHNNARPYMAKATTDKIKTLKWEVLLHPPYSPDLGPKDYHLVQSL